MNQQNCTYKDMSHMLEMIHWNLRNQLIRSPLMSNSYSSLPFGIQLWKSKKYTITYLFIRIIIINFFHFLRVLENELTSNVIKLIYKVKAVMIKECDAFVLGLNIDSFSQFHNKFYLNYMIYSIEFMKHTSFFFEIYYIFNQG